MKRSICVLALIAVMLLSACGGKSNDTGSQNANNGGGGSKAPADSNNAGQPSGEPVEITFWHIFSDTEQGSKTLNSLVDRFQQENPDIKVKVTGYGFFDYQPKLQTATAAGEAPDLAFNDIDNVPLRAKAGTIAKLDDFLAAEPILEGYTPYIADKMKYEGSTYAIPYMIDVRMLYYNKDHFRDAGLDPEKPPANWDELYEYAQKLTVRNGNNFDRIGFAPALGNFFFWTLAWTNGASFFDEAQNPTINSNENVETMEYWVKLQDLYGVKAFQTFNSQVSALNLSPFIAEKVSMVVDGNWLTDDIAKNKPDLDYGVAPIPFQTNRTTWSGGFTLEINGKSDPAKKQAAWRLAKFLASDEATKQYVEETHFLSPNTNGMALANVASDPHFGAFVEESRNIRLRDYIEKAPLWANEVVTAVEKAVLHDKTPREALDEAQKIVTDQIANFK